MQACLVFILYDTGALRLISVYYQRVAGLDLMSARESKYSTGAVGYFHVYSPQCFYF